MATTPKFAPTARTSVMVKPGNIEDADDNAYGGAHQKDRQHFADAHGHRLGEPGQSNGGRSAAPSAAISTAA
jgi:hypothetical protein